MEPAEALERIAARYLRPGAVKTFLSEMGDDIVLIRMVPGQLRTWDFADETSLYNAGQP